MKFTLLAIVFSAIVGVHATPLGEPDVIPGLLSRELGIRAKPGCSVGACGGQIPNNVVCCSGWICVGASAGGTCFKLFGKKDQIEARADE